MRTNKFSVYIVHSSLYYYHGRASHFHIMILKGEMCFVMNCFHELPSFKFLISETYLRSDKFGLDKIIDTRNFSPLSYRKITESGLIFFAANMSWRRFVIVVRPLESGYQLCLLNLLENIRTSLFNDPK